MSEPSLCIKVKKIHGEKTLVLANKLGISNRELKIHQNADNICIPLVRRPDENELAKLKTQLPDFELATQVFTKKKQQRKTLHQVLENQLPPHLLATLPRALDVIGDIAVIEISPELKAHESLIGEAILKTHKNVRTALAKVGAVTGTYRLRKFEVIAGEHRTNTVHKEHGCQYQVDVATAYFSPRLSHEHNRVASIVQKSETVVDLFAGVGPFAVLIAKKNADAKVYAVDINPEAVELLKRNIRLNRVDNRVIPILGDARQAVENQLSGVADRVIMNLPEKALEFVDAACKAVKPAGGTVHYYAFIRLPDSLENAQLRFSEAVEKAGRKVDVFLSAKTIRETAPYECQIVLDAKIL
ncbi:class I SAM-dependent methyltransferase family protein [Candidatus Bathyarchaeota archaeon]|nr:class I SAM-dependent methyltransferase family protein [Candidatus Bathyarchaeota archaeon]